MKSGRAGISRIRKAGLGEIRPYGDGRDEDGDVLANGVYLYKVIMKDGDKSEEVTQKLAIVK